MEKVKELWLKNKYNIFIFIGMIIFTIVICTNFIKPHFALDTYCVYSYDSQELISHFLVSNRIFSALARWIFDILKTPFYINMEILTIIGILCLATSWFVLYKFVVRLKKYKTSFLYNIIIAGITFIIIFNFCTIESLAFWESAIMCLGILCTIIAGCFFNSNMKHSRIKAFLILLIGSLCYQGAITIFIPLTLVFIAYRYKENIKCTFIETIKVGLIYLIVMIINLIGTKIFSYVFNYEFRKMTALSMMDLINTIIRFTADMILTTFGIGTKYWYILAILVLSAIFLIYVIKNKKSKFYILEYIILLVACILIPVLPMLVTPIENQYLETRMAMSFGSSIGILILFLVLVVEAQKNVCLKYVIGILVSIMVVLNCMYYIIASSEMLSTNYLDRNIAKTIIKEIEKYEKETGINVENIGLALDKKAMQIYDSQNWLGVITTRSMGTEWAAKETIEFYSGKKYNKIDVPINYKERFLQNDWNLFDKEQLIFDENNLYICLY